VTVGRFPSGHEPVGACTVDGHQDERPVAIQNARLRARVRELEVLLALERQHGTAMETQLRALRLARDTALRLAAWGGARRPEPRGHTGT
jgi:hypothetical protein